VMFKFEAPIDWENMSGRRSKTKGASGERDAAEALNNVLGTHLHRGRQYHGGPNSPDLAGDIPLLQIEVKRAERFNLYAALAQATKDASVHQVPCVMHRRNRMPWVICFHAEDILRFIDAVESATNAKENSMGDRESPAPQAQAQEEGQGDSGKTPNG